MEEALFCPICLEGFNESRRAPLLLSCGHTFCRECLSLLFSSKRELKCPHCNSVDTRSPDQLSKNFILSDMMLKHFYTSTGGDTDPWACKLHPSENLAFISKSSRQLYCSQCLTDGNTNDLNIIEMSAMSKQLKDFQDIYKNCSIHELAQRAHICSQLSEAMDGQRLRTRQFLDNYYVSIVQALESQFTAYKQRISNAFKREKDKLADISDVFMLLKEMKTLGIPLEHVESRLSVPKKLQIIGSLMSIEQIGTTTDLKRLGTSPFEFHNLLELPPRALEVAVAIAETPLALIRGVDNLHDTSEKKLSRFGVPTNRWGLFDGRNQLEAVTFSVSAKVFATAIGIGNAYQVQKAVKIVSLRLLEGNSTNSPVLEELNNVLMEYHENSPKVFKACLRRPVELAPHKEYTIRVMLLGEAGVFRGGATSRVRTTEDGLTFKFKPTVYAQEDVKNGENADDGPIFDIHYKLSLGAPVQETRAELYKSVLSSSMSNNGQQVEAIGFSVDMPCQLLGFLVGAPVDPQESVIIDHVEVRLEDQVVYQGAGPTAVSHCAAGTGPVQLQPPLMLEPRAKYILAFEKHCTAPLYMGRELRSNRLQLDAVSLTVTEEVPDLPPMAERSLLALLLGLGDHNAFTLGEVPHRLVELAGGESKLTRFETEDKAWSLSTENQVESFSFTFSENVLLTAFGVGNCATMGSFITLESLQVLAGQSSVGTALYSAPTTLTLYNHTDTHKVIKVPLDAPVRVPANTPHTIRMVLRGDGKCYKGKNFRGGSLVQPDGVIFNSLKCKMGGNDKRNGDNESSGPIFDVYYIQLDKNYSLEHYLEVQKLLFPMMNDQRTESKDLTGEELHISRFSGTGSSWHINTDGKQVEAISFKVSVPIKLSAIGVANAYEQGKKITIKKLQIRNGNSTRGSKLYSHSYPEKLINVGDDSKFVRTALETFVAIAPDTWYTIRLKYKPGNPVCRGTSVDNAPSVADCKFTFEKSKFEGGDVENGSHEVHGPLKDFFFFLG